MFDCSRSKADDPSILRKNVLGYRPIQNINTTIGIISAISRPFMSVNWRLASWVISPYMTRWYIHNMYTAPKIMPSAAKIA